MEDTTYYLFSNDLRLVDNPALNEALETYEEIIPVIVLESREPFYLTSVIELQQELQNIGSNLYVFDNMDIFDKFYLTSNIMSNIEYSDKLSQNHNGLYTIKEPNIDHFVADAKYPILNKYNKKLMSNNKIKGEIGGRKEGLHLFCNCNKYNHVSFSELIPHIEHGTLSTREIYNFILQLYGRDSKLMKEYLKFIS